MSSLLEENAKTISDEVALVDRGSQVHQQIIKRRSMADLLDRSGSNHNFEVPNPSDEAESTYLEMSGDRSETDGMNEYFSEHLGQCQPGSHVEQCKSTYTALRHRSPQPRDSSHYPQTPKPTDPSVNQCQASSTAALASQSTSAANTERRSKSDGHSEPLPVPSTQKPQHAAHRSKRQPADVPPLSAMGPAKSSPSHALNRDEQRRAGDRHKRKHFTPSEKRRVERQTAVMGHTMSPVCHASGYDSVKERVVRVCQASDNRARIANSQAYYDDEVYYEEV